MKSTFLKYSVYLLLVSLSLASCKKKSDPAPEEDTTEQSKDIADENSVASEADASDNDADAAQNWGSNGSMRISADPLIQGATIDTSQLSSKHKLVINYDGKTTVNKRVRMGSLAVELTHGNHWKEAGAVLKLTYNYKVTWANNKSWSFTGTKTITNVSGGLVKLLYIQPIIIHKISGSLKIVFEDNTSRSWYFSRVRTVSLNTGNIMVSYNGDTTVNGNHNIDMGGVTRKGKEFYMQVQQPLVFTTQCEKVINGIRIYKGMDKEITVTYGVDAMGTQVNSCAAYGYKLNWLNSSGGMQQAVVSY